MHDAGRGLQSVVRERREDARTAEDADMRHVTAPDAQPAFAASLAPHRWRCSR
jgi:hypothetical protein